ncbi:MAG: hypothetical protein NC397_05390 [Clostridium sp.]|nr:hypothetical protein [Clostridium sp.]
MKTFLIIVAVLSVLIVVICSLSATVTLIYDKGWQTKVKVLFIEKDIVLSEILSFILFPAKKAEDAANASKKKKSKKGETDAESEALEEVKQTADEITEKVRQKDEKVIKEITFDNPDEAQVVKIIEGEDGPTAVLVNKPKDASADAGSDKEQSAPDAQNKNEKPKKSNPIKKMWDEEGIVGIMSFVSNLLETANSAILTLIRGLHIYSLYVMILVGGGDAADIAQAYGTLCKYYYPMKGMILSSMKVDNYDDCIQPDFIAPRTDFEFQLIASINVGLLLKVVFKAAFVFLKNLIKNKKGDK